MKYLAIIRNVLILAAIVLLNPVAIAGHASASSTMPHDMHSGSHRSANSLSPSCISVCTTATLKDNEETKLVTDKQDDEPVPHNVLPYYAHFGSNFIPKKLLSSYVQKHLIFRPPDLVKLYSNYRF